MCYSSGQQSIAAVILSLSGYDNPDAGINRFMPLASYSVLIALPSGKELSRRFRYEKLPLGCYRESTVP